MRRGEHTNCPDHGAVQGAGGPRQDRGVQDEGRRSMTGAARGRLLYYLSLNRRALAPLAWLRAYARGAVAPAGLLCSPVPMWGDSSSVAGRRTLRACAPTHSSSLFRPIPADPAKILLFPVPPSTLGGYSLPSGAGRSLRSFGLRATRAARARRPGVNVFPQSPGAHSVRLAPRYARGACAPSGPAARALVVDTSSGGGRRRLRACVSSHSSSLSRPIPANPVKILLFPVPPSPGPQARSARPRAARSA